ncbi:MAG: hypothetical protein HYZ33_02155 [Ignavibacteriales bacterium]|nr:hypothetical protein [Ignavibacteriales bacterium]
MFFNKVANGKKDFLEEFLDLLKKENINYCVIGGLAVNAYAEPVVSLDLDIVVAVSDLTRLEIILIKKWKLKKDRFSVNISSPDSDFRIQIQTDERYQEFIERAEQQTTLGYELSVASLEDVLRGKLWAYADSERRPSKRQKDLADVMRLVESHPEVLSTPAGKLAKEIISRR